MINVRDLKHDITEEKLNKEKASNVGASLVRINAFSSPEPGLSAKQRTIAKSRFLSSRQ